jgi:soluble lytic murein transglycosylase-like protein
LSHTSTAIAFLLVAASAQAQPATLMQESIARQRAAAQKQLALARSFWVGTIADAVIAPTCEAASDSDVSNWIASAAAAHQIKPELLRAVIRQESAFRPCAISPKGAMGLMQLMPETAEQFRVEDPFDPAQNVLAGARYLKQLLDRFGGDVRLALAAYNAGPARVEGKQIPDIPETRQYVQQIVSELEKTKP